MNLIRVSVRLSLNSLRGRSGQGTCALSGGQLADPAPDWPQIAALYGALLRHKPTPVVQLNAAVAIAEAGDPARGRTMVETLTDLAEYQPFHATRAALLAMISDHQGATAAYQHATSPTRAEALFLARRMEGLGSGQVEL